MKKVALITSNRILGQSLRGPMKDMANFDYEFFLLLDTKQALIDAEIFDIDIALIDIMNREQIGEETPFSFFQDLHEKLPDCHILLLVSQNDDASRKLASLAKEKGLVEDFVFYDASLKYLFSKLNSFGHNSL